MLASHPVVVDAEACWPMSTCATELLGKSKIVHSIGAGWTVAAPGCVPQRPPDQVPCGLALPRSGHDEATVATSNVSRSACGVFQSCRQVLHFTRGRFHLFCGGKRTMCRLWECGTSPLTWPPNHCLPNSRLTGYFGMLAWAGLSQTGV